MSTQKSDKEQFLENYRGILKPEIAWQEAQARLQNKEIYSNATYNQAENARMEREANNRMRRRYY
jgi:hypothetical protein